MEKLFSDGVALHLGDKDMNVLDLGCGFDEAMGQASVKDAVGIDLNFHRGEAMVKHPIMGDVCHVSIRDDCIDYIHAHAILEHLFRPGLCLDEMKRTMKAGAKGSILLPVDSHNVPQILRRFIKEFPFSLGWVLDKLFRSVTLWRAPGMLHISQVNIEDVERWFNVDRERVQYNRRLHKWFVHMAPFTILCRLGWIRRLEVEEYADVVIPITHSN